MFQALIGPIGSIVGTWLEGSVAKAKAKAKEIAVFDYLRQFENQEKRLAA